MKCAKVLGVNTFAWHMTLVSTSVSTYSVFVHVTPDPSSNFTGEQDDQADEKLQ